MFRRHYPLPRRSTCATTPGNSRSNGHMTVRSRSWNGKKNTSSSMSTVRDRPFLLIASSRHVDPFPSTNRRHRVPPTDPFHVWTRIRIPTRKRPYVPRLSPATAACQNHQEHGRRRREFNFFFRLSTIPSTTYFFLLLLFSFYQTITCMFAITWGESCGDGKIETHLRNLAFLAQLRLRPPKKSLLISEI